MATASRIVLIGLAVNHLADALFIEQSPTPLKFHDLNLKQDATFYRASGPMDKCNRVGRTITADPYKKACRLNGRRKRDKGGVKSASVCLCVETDAFLRLKINAANNFVDDADQTEVNDDTGYARVCGVCDRNGKFKPDGGRNRWIPQKIRDFGETVNDAIDTLRNLFRNKRDADDNDSDVEAVSPSEEGGGEEERREGYRRRNNFNNWRKNIQKQINNAQKQVNDAVAPWTSTRLPIIGDIVPVNKRDADEDEGSDVEATTTSEEEGERKEGYRRRNNFGNWRKRVQKQVNNAANTVQNHATVPSVSLPVIGDVTSGKKRKRDADEDEGSEVDTDTTSTSDEGEEEEGKQGYRLRWPRPPTINLPDVNIPVTVNLPDVNVCGGLVGCVGNGGRKRRDAGEDGG